MSHSRVRRLPLNGILTAKAKVGRLITLNPLIKRSKSLFELIGIVGQIRNKTKFNYEGDKLYAFKPQPHRYLCFFFEGQKIIVTNAFHKKTDKLPENEKDRALRTKKDYETRVKRGDYYE